MAFRISTGIARRFSTVTLKQTQTRSYTLCRSVVPTTQVVGHQAACIQKRTWFGFGMPKDAAEIAQEGQPSVPIYAREPEDDSADYMSGNELWTAEERGDREDIARELYKMADSQPPVKLDNAFYEKVFTILIKYDDWRGVKTARSLASESGVTLDDSLSNTVSEYLESAEKRSYHEEEGW